MGRSAITFLFLACLVVLPTDANAQRESDGSMQRLCFVQGNGSVKCFTTLSIKQLARDAYHAKKAEEALKEINSAAIAALGRVSEIDRTKNTLVGCKASGEFSLVSLSPAEASNLDSDPAKLVAACEPRVDSLLEARPGGYTSTKDAAVAKTEKEITSCTDGPKPPGSTLYTGVASGNPVSVVWKILNGMAKAQQSKEDSMQGAKDGAAGMDPQKPRKDWTGTKTSYGKAYDIAKGLHDKAKAQEQTTNPDPDPPGPDPPDPGPGPKPDPDPEPKPGPDPSSCADENCPNHCESKAVWWSFFKRQCDQSDWQLYACKTFVAAQNPNCADPGLVIPTPDGDYQCRKPMSDEEKLAFWRAHACEEKGNYPVQPPDGRSIECKDPSELMVDDPLGVFIQRSCLYSYDEAGKCFAGTEPPIPETAPLPGQDPLPKPEDFRR